MAFVHRSYYSSKAVPLYSFGSLLAKRRIKVMLALFCLAVVIGVLVRAFALGYSLLAIWAGSALVAWLFILGAGRAGDLALRRRR